ncbi:MAG: HEAT repeat domain-containing protein, partial [Chthonomonadales bacterium]
DGLMLYTYFENFDTRFTDEFGFNEPIVAEFKKRYGVDIRTQDFDHAKWGELRGEYITEFLRQLHTGLKINGKQLRICLSANNPETMQEWPFNSGQVNMRIKMDWRTWLKEGVVDQVCVMGGSDDKGGEFIQRLLDAGAKPSQVCLFTERPFYQSLKKWVDRGVTIVGWSAPFATQPLERYMMDEVSEADLSSLDWKRRAQALVGLKAGTLSAETQKQLEAQAADANLLVRREAMIAIARVGTKNPKIIEDALADPESCVRTEAALAASSSMTDQMLRRLLLEVDRRPDWMFAEAVAEAINKSKLRTSPALTEMLSNPSPAVRRIAAREAKADSETTRKLLRHILSLDTDSAARYYAVATYVDSGVDFLQCLSTCMLDSDPIVSNQATVLTRQLASKLTPEEKRTLSRLLAGRFLQYDSKSKRTDKDWGWRNAVDTLLVLNDQDKKSVEDQLYSDDSVLRNYVYMGLYLPHKEHSYAPVTETEAAEITRFWAETYQASRPPSTIKF